MTLEVDYWKSVAANAMKRKIVVLDYKPERRKLPPRVLEVRTAWKGIESVLSDIIERFGIASGRCLEFGVEHGYSTAALSCFFDSVTGVDTFIGDQHTVDKGDIYKETAKRLSPFANIKLVQSGYRNWIANDDSFYDLIHVDIVHTYADTFACGYWSAMHAKCVLFHDTESFRTVKRAVMDIADRTEKQLYNFKESNGLGILI